jgi:hypothetical protein
MDLHNTNLIRTRFTAIARLFQGMPLHGIKLQVAVKGLQEMDMAQMQRITLKLDSNATGKLVASAVGHSTSEALSHAFDSLRQQVSQARVKYLSQRRPGLVPGYGESKRLQSCSAAQ